MKDLVITKTQIIIEQYKELLSLLRKYGDETIIPSYRILEDAIDNLQNESDEEKSKEIIVDSYRKLYWGNGSLSDYNVWVDDYNERIKLNKPFGDIHEYLWNEVKEYF